MKDTVLRSVGQFQLMEDKSEGTFYVQNTILIKKGNGAGKSYSFQEDRKKTLMLVSDSEFVSRAKQAAGNDIG